MDGPRRYYVKWSKSDKDKYCMISSLCNLKNKRKKENRNRFIGKESKLMVARGGGGYEDGWKGKEE